MTILTRGAVTLDTETGEVTAGGGTGVHLTRTQTRVFAALMTARGQCTHEQIMDVIWDGRSDGPADEKFPSVIVCHIRRRLRSIGAGDFIRTDWGRGYRVEGAAENITTLTLTDGQRFALRAVLRAARSAVPKYVEVVEACL